MDEVHTAIVHYSSPPTIGGVETVIQAHAKAFTQAGYPVTVITGRGSPIGLPPKVDFFPIALMDTQHPIIVEANRSLEKGVVPVEFEAITEQLVQELRPILQRFDTVIVHNIFTKHFNLPLTAALHRLLDEGKISNCIAWCHDISWTSPSSRSKLSEGYPWSLLRACRSDIRYVAISEVRRQEVEQSFACPPEEVQVIYNGVDPVILLGLSKEGGELIERLGIWESDLVFLMPVRVTHAKNIEYALQFVAAIKEAGIRVKLILTGPPDPHDNHSMEYFQQLQKLRRDFGIEEEMRFIFESGPTPSEPMMIGQEIVGELYRVSDFLFMPSLREGFGMPVLEAGLAGVPVISTEIPAAVEIGDEDVLLFSTATKPDYLAEQVVSWMQDNPVYQFRKRIRQKYTWKSIFERQIKPLLLQKAS